MKHIELELEHYYKNKFVGKRRLTSKNKTTVLGSSRKADLRLQGDDVSEIHAFIQYDDGNWTLVDATSQQGTWVNKKHITIEELKDKTTVTIGGHTLKLNIKTIEKDVFTSGRLDKSTTSGSFSYHQIVVRRDGMMMYSETVAATSPYNYDNAGVVQLLTPPKKDEVKETQFGKFTVTQRLVKSEHFLMTSKDYLANLQNPEWRAPIMAGLVLLFILSLLVYAIPEKPIEELDEIKPANKYTRMIFDADLMKKKKAEAKEMRKTIMASAPKSEQQNNTITTAVKSKGATPKVVSNLKLEGLTALLGKISKRANKNAPMIVGFGKTADSSTAGHVTTVAAVGSLQGISTGAAGNGGDTYKVGGVGTFGKGGGSGRGLAGIGGLATGGAGTGTVGILDEETEIEGGLDKEVIARTIANYLGEIRYCYERQLSAEPDIYGKVSVKFTIDAEGTVAEHRIGATTLKSAMVEGCILRRLARWKFPKPKGGTHVLVTYPFMFKSTN